MVSTRMHSDLCLDQGSLFTPEQLASRCDITFERYRSYACTLESFAAKMFHLKAATCQDVPSFGRGTL